MAQVQFGTVLRTFDDIPKFAQDVERLGYDVLGCGEHVSFYGPAANTYISLAVAAGATSTLKLMSSIVLLPLYPAALAAKMGAALDVASNGRYLFGVGVGGENPKEFAACGVPVTERGARTNEALEVIRKLWTEKDVSFSGRFTEMEGITIQPAPTTNPHPPVWVAGRKDAAMRRTGRYGDGWLPYMYTPEQLAASMAKVREAAVDAGRDPSAIRCGVFCFSCVHEDGETGTRFASEGMGRTYQQDFTKLVGKYAVSGTPDQCKSRIQEYIDAGAEFVVLPPACPDEYADRSVEMMAKEVISAFR